MACGCSELICLRTGTKDWMTSGMKSHCRRFVWLLRITADVIVYTFVYIASADSIGTVVRIHFVPYSVWSNNSDAGSIKLQWHHNRNPAERLRRLGVVWKAVLCVLWYFIQASCAKNRQRSLLLYGGTCVNEAVFLTTPNSSFAHVESSISVRLYRVPKSRRKLYCFFSGWMGRK